MKKIIFAAASMMLVTTSFANLTLINNTKNNINVACGSLGIGFPIGPNNSRSLDWSFLASLFTNSFKCTFTGATMTGVAYVNIPSDTSTGALYNISASGVNLDYNSYSPEPDNYATNITVTINP